VSLLVVGIIAGSLFIYAAGREDTGAPEATETVEATEEAVDVEETEEPTPEPVILSEDAYRGDLYSLRYPEGWTVTAGEEGEGRTDVIFSRGPDKDGAALPNTFVVVTTSEISARNDAGTLLALMWDEARQRVGAQELPDELDAGELSVDGKPGAFACYSALVEETGETVYIYVAAIIPDGRSFTLTLFSTDEADQAIAEEMLRSVSFVVEEEEDVEDDVEEGATEEDAEDTIDDAGEGEGETDAGQ
jgi:hypothetical protein